MEEVFYLNPSMMMELSRKMDGCEIKMLLGMLYYLLDTNSSLFVNSKESRECLGSIGLHKTPERICSILSSMVKKGIIKRVAHSVYALPKGLYYIPQNNS